MTWLVNDCAVKSEPALAVPLEVAMSKVTPPGPAAALRLYGELERVVPALPSFKLTSLTDR